MGNNIDGRCLGTWPVLCKCWGGFTHCLQFSWRGRYIVDPFQWFQCLLVTDMKMFVTFSQPVSLPWWQISPERHRKNESCVPWSNRSWTPSALAVRKWNADGCYMNGPPSWGIVSCAKFPDCVENVLRTPKGASHRKYTGPGPRHMAHFFCTRIVHFMWGFLRPWNSSLLLQFKQSFHWLERRGLSLSCPIAFECHRPLLLYL